MPSDQVLRSVVSPADLEWNFPHARKLNPPNQSQNENYFLRHVSFSHEKITLSEGYQKSNRILGAQENPSRNIITVSFERLRFPDNYKAGPEYISRVLKRGVVLNGVTFKLYGHSNSQLKSHTCYLIAETNEKKIWEKINNFGDFSGINSTAKRAKRIGLLFSAAEMGFKLDQSWTQDIPDIEDKGHIFTDGCGFISKWYAQQLAIKKKIIYRDQKYIPSVYQIRYKGYKGTVSVNPELDKMAKEEKKPIKNSIHFHFRDSMRKFKNCPDDTFSVLEYSQPYVFAKLNGELVSLLSSLGIPDDIFLKKLDTHLNFIKNASSIDQCAFLYLTYHNKPELAEKIVLDGLGSNPKILSTIKSLQTEDYKRFYKKDEEKVHIMIQDSRLLFGIADSTGKLREDQVFVRITKEGEGVKSLAGAKILVGRNPCLHPGDVQKFKAVHIDELAHLSDCIVFSTKGPRPQPSLLSGGDLDGDKFFVCWDPDLIPSKLCEAYDYPPAKEGFRRNIGYEDMINYFSKYNNASLGKTKKLYLQWMKCKPEGALSKECQELNTLFSSCVDGQPIKIPDHLQNPPENPHKEFILDKICNKVKAEVTQRVQLSTDQNLLDSLPMEIMDVIMSSDKSCLDEFELLHLVYHWTLRNRRNLADFLPYFDFGSLTSLQKHWVARQLPPADQEQWLGIIFNDLYTSEIVDQHDLKQHNLDSHTVKWKRLYSTSTDGNGKGSNLSAVLQKALELFHRKLIIVRVNSRFAYGIYISKPMTRKLMNLTECCKLFAFTSVPEGHVIWKIVTESDYQLHFDGDVFQLYQNNTTNSFVYFRFANHLDPKQQQRRQPKVGSWREGQNGKSDFSRPEANINTNDEDSDLNLITSVALDKFSLGVKTHVGRIYRQTCQMVEIYVISNRDRIGHQILDISMKAVATVEIMKIIQSIPNEYTIPSILDIQGNENIPPKIIQVITHWPTTPVITLVLAMDLSELKKLCQVCIEYDLVSHLTGIIDQALDHSDKLVDAGGFFDLLPDFLTAAPYLSPSVAQLVGIRDEPKINTSSLCFSLCRSLIKCANEYKEMALNLFKRMVERMLLHGQIFDASTTIEVVKMILFTIRNADLAQDFLSELFLGRQNDGPSLIQATNDGGGPMNWRANEYFVKFVLASAMNYISEIKETCSCGLDGRFLNEGSDDASKNGHGHGSFLKPVMTCLRIKRQEKDASLFETNLRIDVRHSIRNGDHLRLRAASLPLNAVNASTAAAKISANRKRTIIDIIVDSIYNGCMKFRIMQRTPVEIENASWDLFETGSPTTTITTFEAMQLLIEQKMEATWSYKCVVDNFYHGEGRWNHVGEGEMDQFLTKLNLNMNQSQTKAIKLAINNGTTLIWGPPGTGKTTTVVSIVLMILHFFPQKKILVTASTHNATDNILERLVKELKKKTDFADTDIIRVTSEISKVKKSLQGWTLDAFVGANLHDDQKKKKEALLRVKNARIVASTCSGAGVGILRHEELKFQVVIVDEASQLTEPNALVPIVKGSEKAILVGDHVQLRPTVSELGKAYNLDYSLFERLYTQTKNNNVENNSSLIATAMLQKQYRMNPRLVKFPNETFYDGQLESGVTEIQRCPPPSGFQWPEVEGPKPALIHPVVFVQCDSKESPGASKLNKGQVKVVAEIVKKLRTTTTTSTDPVTITVLTPYSRQVVELKNELKNVDVFTIDGFQGREADIIIFSTTRCNQHGAVGFLDDSRRMNVALTRAKVGLIVVGDEGTLRSNEMWQKWLLQCTRVEIALPK